MVRRSLFSACFVSAFCVRCAASASSAATPTPASAHRTRRPGNFTKSPQELDRALQQLDPRLHTMGMVHLLAARAQLPVEDGAVFLDHCQRLFGSGVGEQARMEPKRCVRIVHRLTALATEYAMPLRVVTTLEKALHLVQETEHQLTAVHADLLQVCLLAKHYQRAGDLLRAKPVLSIGDAKVNGFTQADYLRYWYYAGLVYTGLKSFNEALDAFEQCFSAPAMVLSAPAVEAYKKFVLVSLIQRGGIDTKRSGNPMMVRNLKATCQRYVEFSVAFATKDTDALAKAAQDGMEAFTRDGNWGLVQQCIESLADRQIRALTQTYMTLSLDTLARGANLPTKEEASRRLVAMVSAGTIVAKVNEKEGMVSFGESAEQYNDARTLSNLNAEIFKAVAWGSHMRALDDQIASSAEYLQRTSGLMGGGGEGGGRGGMGPGGFEAEMMGAFGYGGDFGNMG